MSDEPIVGTLDERLVTDEQPYRRPRRHYIKDPEIRALAAFTAALDAMSPASRTAAIRWLADRYIGQARRAGSGDGPRS